MRYSIESTYLNGDAVAKEELLHEVLKYENKVLPKYTTFMSIILTDNDVSEEQLVKILEFKEKN
jgi:hypothetical protein